MHLPHKISRWPQLQSLSSHLPPLLHSSSLNLRHLPEPSKGLLLNQRFVTIPGLYLKARIQLLLLTPKSCSPINGLSLDWLNHSISILPQSLQIISIAKKQRRQSPECIKVRIQLDECCKSIGHQYIRFNFSNVGQQTSNRTLWPQRTRGTSYDRSNFECWQNCNETSCMIDAKQWQPVYMIQL